MKTCNMEIEHYSRGLSFDKMTMSALGEQFCKSGHKHGPQIRENYIFHFAVSGKGIFKAHGKTYRLGANQGFLIGDSTPVYYEADEKEPWHYCWIIFSDKQAENFFKKIGLSAEFPIYTAKAENNVYSKFKSCMRAFDNGSDYESASAFYALLDEFIKSAGEEQRIIQPKEDYLHKAEQYILHHYHSPLLRIGLLASEIGIDRSYLTRLFNEKFGHNPQEYILRLRMEKAKTFLQTTDYSVGTIANSVGYPELDAFSKMFKNYYGCSPSAIRKNKNG